MENSVFDELLAEGTAVDTEIDENQGNEDADFDHSFDLSDDDLASNEDNETPEESTSIAEDEGGEATNVVENPTNTAFAQMRTQNKEFQTKINKLDALAKELGMKDLDDFIAKAEEANVKKNATAQGIPVEVAKELKEMRDLRDAIVAEREENAAKQKEQVFVSNLQEFVNNNNLSKSAIDKLSVDLDKDGFSVETLMNMPKTALNKVLGSYVDTKYQKNLERKDTIRKEIDALARQLAGK